MITNFSSILVLLLFVLTALGAVIGYCIALIVVKNSARQAIEESRVALMQERHVADSILNKAKSGIEKVRQPDGQSFDRATSEREKVLLDKSRGQAEQIQNLEEEIVTLVEEQQRLQRHLASYKANNKIRELALARSASGSMTNKDDLPTLSRRVDPVTGQVADPAPSLHIKSARDSSDAEKQKPSVLVQPLSPELDIPTLAESELPEIAEDLEFDIAESEHPGTEQGG